MRDRSSASIPDVFLSYAGPHEKDARRLADSLRRRGLRPWIAVDLSPGADWRQEADQALRGARAFALLVGPRSGYYDQHELGMALEQHRTRGMRIIPILLPGAQATGLGIDNFVKLNLRIGLEAVAEAIVRALADGASAAPVLCPVRSRRTALVVLPVALLAGPLVWLAVTAARGAAFEILDTAALLTRLRQHDAVVGRVFADDLVPESEAHSTRATRYSSFDAHPVSSPDGSPRLVIKADTGLEAVRTSTPIRIRGRIVFANRGVEQIELTLSRPEITPSTK